MSTILEIKHLKKYFETKAGLLHAVDDVSFSVEKGETLGVVGESGCGKSTLGRTIQHLLDATDGTIIFKGRDVTHLSKRETRDFMKEVQMIFQDPYSSLNPRMTVKQIIMEPLLIDGVKKKEAEAKVREMMETVGLDARFENAYPNELDGGRRQRIGIARALILKPDFIICDEPVSALDVSIQAQILNLMQDLQEQMGLTYIFVTHDLSVVKHISNKIAVMYLGNLVEYSETEELFANPAHPYTRALLASVPTIDLEKAQEIQTIAGEITSPINPKPGCRFAARCPHAMEACFARQPEMHEVSANHFVACHLLDKG
ncbi:MAG: oligopeptide/dipeptide ABC transporter ATP-binding protein [Candidatus Faecousia sp.]|nr:oligopeptide/dipeptide ABC transporter ATP-binding protein [Candidatus Faecousia sp.]